jgi:hypothetical protein
MSRIPKLASERGAVLVQTAVASFVLVGFSTFVIDHGILSTARHQAQNAADAGAMAGALARAYEDFDDPPDGGGVADQMATQVATTNLVWGESSPNTAAVASFDCPPDIGGGRCVRVDVYRNGQYGSTSLPTLFGRVLSIASQRTKATATAQVHVANATNCLRPWAIPDRWQEGSVPPDPSFKKWKADGTELGTPDTYTPPNPLDPGPTSLRFATSNVALGDLGLSVPTTLYTALSDPIVPGWVVPLDPPGSSYAASRDGCNGQSISVGDSVRVSATIPIAFDFHNFFAADSFASWNGRAIDDSCAPLSCTPPSAISPRLAAIAVFDADIFQYRQATGNWSLCPPTSPSCVPCPGGNPCVSIVNIVGFFIGDGTGSSGTLTSYPGIIPTEAPRLSAASSFLKAVNLVR